MIAGNERDPPYRKGDYIHYALIWAGKHQVYANKWSARFFCDGREFEPQDTKFVVSPNAPVRQMWVSAMAKSYKLSWAAEIGSFALNGEPLVALLERLTREFLGGGV